MRLEWLGGAAAIALLATMGTASAFLITQSSSPLLNLGIGNGPGFQNNANIPPGMAPVPAGVLNGTGIANIMFNDGAATVGGTANPSGVYSGTVTNVATSPFGGGNQNYLAAQPGGSVAINYGATNLQNSIEILWGTVDNNSTTRNLITAAGQMISGVDIINAIPTLTPGLSNVEVLITGLTPFASYTASDATGQLSAFEFVPGTAVPEPTSMAILGAALAGFGVLRRRKTT